jgi:hypothetical protein
MNVRITRQTASERQALELLERLVAWAYGSRGDIRRENLYAIAGEARDYVRKQNGEAQ